MSNERLQQIRQRVEVATEGPLEVRHEHEMLIGYARVAETHDGYILVRKGKYPNLGIQPRLDAEFFAHAREDIPWLLSQLERREQRINELLEDITDLEDALYS